MDRGKGGLKRSMAVDAKDLPLAAVSAPANPHDSLLLVPTLQVASEVLWGRVARGDKCPPRPRLRLACEPRAS